MRNVSDLSRYGRDVALFAAMAMFLAFINPYNATGALPFHWALIYWFAMIIAGGLSATLAMSAYTNLLPRAPEWGMLLVGALVSALSVTGFIVTIEHIFNEGVPLWYWTRLYGLVFVISAAITAVGYLVSRAFDPVEKAEQRPDAAKTFLQRLPVKYRTATLYAVSSEDHYLRVHTSLGEDLILMRLADAVRELSGADGLQVHRSWWIARAGITDEKRESGRSLLILPSGTEVPVSRSYRPKAKAAGLIA